MAKNLELGLKDFQIKKAHYKYFEKDEGHFKKGSYLIAEMLYINEDNKLVSKTGALNFIDILKAFAEKEKDYIKYKKSLK